MVVGLGLNSARARLGLLLGLASACGSAPETTAPPVSSEPTGWNEEGMTSPDDDGTATGAEADGTATGGEANCGDMQCTGPGSCELVDDVPTCVCDDGYRYDMETGECVVNENCVEVRYLEDRCRQIFDGPPAVSLFFAVDFCAGNAVLPEDKERLQLDFVVLEDGEDISLNPESDSKILTRSVENYVTIAIDVSGTVVDEDDWPALVDEIRGFVEGLTPSASEPDVYVSIVLFGNDHGEYVAFTRDLTAIDAALQTLTGDPATFEDVAGNPMGTDLYDAVEFAIRRTSRAREFRDAVSWGGQLTTGTIVVVTDGTDESGGTLDTALVQGTTNQIISIGVTDEIEDEYLQTIGPDGSFLAPTPTEWGAAFDQILTRVDQYPERSYLLAYCSSRTEGTPQVEVRMKSLDPDVELEVRDTAACDFKADYFSSDPDQVCTIALFEEECDDKDCGGISACGACDDGECCDGIKTGRCVSPQDVVETELSCEGQTELCPDGLVCGGPPTGLECQPPVGVGEGCSDAEPCEPGVAWCTDPQAGTCEETLGLGEPCGDEWASCESQHCDRTKPENAFEMKICQPPAQMFDSCGNTVGTCEIGTYCAGSKCEARLWDVESCGEGNQCRHAACIQLESGMNICGGPDACYFAWDDKFPD